MSHCSTIFQSMRPPFLILTPICVFLGVAVADYEKYSIAWSSAALACIAAICAHISVNTLNEYQDFSSGLDLETQRTPFSGGSGSLLNQPNAANSVFITAAISLAICIAIGVYLAWLRGPQLPAWGALGIAIIVSYTRYLNKLPSLGLLASGFGFGFLMVGGASIASGGAITSSLILAAIVPFLLVNNLLLLNQFPDADIDKKFGRNHAVIAWGEKISTRIYAIFASIVVATLLYGVKLKLFPSLALIALIPSPLLLVSVIGTLKHGKKIGLQPQYLAANVAATLFIPLLLGIAFFLKN